MKLNLDCNYGLALTCIHFGANKSENCNYARNLTRIRNIFLCVYFSASIRPRYRFLQLQTFLLLFLWFSDDFLVGTTQVWIFLLILSKSRRSRLVIPFVNLSLRSHYFTVISSTKHSKYFLSLIYSYTKAYNH